MRTFLNAGLTACGVGYLFILYSAVVGACRKRHPALGLCPEPAVLVPVSAIRLRSLAQKRSAESGVNAGLRCRSDVCAYT